MIESDGWYQYRKHSFSNYIGEMKMKKASEKKVFTPTETNDCHRSTQENEPVSFSSYQKWFIKNNEQGEEGEAERGEAEEGEEGEAEGDLLFESNTKKEKGTLTPENKTGATLRSNRGNKIKTTKFDNKPKKLKSLFLNNNKNNQEEDNKSLKQNDDDEGLTPKGRKNNRNDSLSKKKASATVIQSMISKKESEIKKLTNTEEISDFFEYNECCMEMIQTLNPLCASPPQITLPFSTDIPASKRLAVFDLDETLVHALFKNIDKAQYTISVKLPSKQIAEIGLNIRPNWKEALDQIMNNYFIVVYTASDHSYADSVLNFMDPNDEYFKYRLYRNNCLTLQGKNKQKVYVKDLNIFKGIDLKDIVIIDNSLLSYAYHLNNGIPILPYYDSQNDLELIFLAGYLNAISEIKDLREANKKYIQLDVLQKEKQKEIEEEEQEQKVIDDKEKIDLNIKPITTQLSESTNDTSRFLNEKIVKKKVSLLLGEFLKEFHTSASLSS